MAQRTASPKKNLNDRTRAPKQSVRGGGSFADQSSKLDACAPPWWRPVSGANGTNSINGNGHAAS
jgi:hypothetical protein